MSKRSMVAAVLLGVAVAVVMSSGAQADWVSAISASTRVWPGDAVISLVIGLFLLSGPSIGIFLTSRGRGS